MIAAGLPREAAVDALTRRAAEIAGLGRRLGTIEPGKLGHLVVLTARYGDESAKVRYVLVDGLKFDLEKPGPSRKADSERQPRPEEGKAGEAPKEKEAPKAEPAPATPPRTPEVQPPPTPFVDVATEFDATRKPRIQTGGNVLIKDATILTVTKGDDPQGLDPDQRRQDRRGRPRRHGSAERHGHRRGRAGRDARDHRHPLAHGHPGGRQRV